jgi:hypothetical protein
LSTRTETTLLALIALSIAGIAVGLFWWSLSIPWIGLKVAAASSLGKPGYSTGVELRLASEHPRMDRDYSGAYKHFGGKD